MISGSLQQPDQVMIATAGSAAAQAASVKDTHLHADETPNTCQASELQLFKFSALITAWSQSGSGQGGPPR